MALALAPEVLVLVLVLVPVEPVEPLVDPWVPGAALVMVTLDNCTSWNFNWLYRDLIWGGTLGCEMTPSILTLHCAKAACMYLEVSYLTLMNSVNTTSTIQEREKNNTALTNSRNSISSSVVETQYMHLSL